MKDAKDLNTILPVDGMETDASTRTNHADDSIHGGLGSQQIVQITDTGLRWIVGLMMVFVVVVAISMLGIGYAIVQANEAREQARVAANEARQQAQAFIRLQASLVARGVALSEADPLINTSQEERSHEQRRRRRHHNRQEPASHHATGPALHGR